MSNRLPGHGLAFWTATGLSGVLALALINVAADKATGSGPLTGVARFRDYLVRRNG